jgi:hypothetical protein
MPTEARKTCEASILPPSPTNADLDNGYDVRGAQIAICDGRRDLAVQAFDAQTRALTPPPKPFWARLFGG